MANILDGLLFAGPALALVLGFLFAFSSSSRLLARRPRQIALGVLLPMLVSVAGAVRVGATDGDTAVLLAVIGMALLACAVGFAGAFGFGLLLRASSQWMAGPGSRHQFGDTGVSTLIARRSRSKGLPPGPRIKQGK
ncbi:hypothetical protein ACFPOE_19770 [Caenimonas terrae]|uniref:Uncharacterized protein n=1 Tax=Caenimonas terrae TaxID=696074 RepID=A0ABW0NGK4_9BURK